MFLETFTQFISKKNALFALSFVLCQWAFAQTALVGGKITSWCNEAEIGGVTVVAANSAGETTVAITEADGTYLLELEEGENYTIAPYSNDQPLNGVSTFDFLVIQKHIDSVQLMTNSYQLIAADINNSGTIDPIDLFDLRNSILFLTNGFANNTSWRFFHDMNEVHTISSLTDDVLDLDWTAVKIGDVNCSPSSPVNLDPDPSYLSVIAGHVYQDDNSNCMADAGETSLANWDVVATNATASYHARSDEDGNYHMLVPNGTYDIEVFPPNALWNACNPIYVQEAVPFPSTSTYDFGAVALGDCPWMTVDLGTPFLRRCFENTYFVTYCNQGTQDAMDAEVVIEFDAFFENISPSIPATSINGNTYTFDLGDVAVGECGTFLVDFEISCDAELEQTHCTSAHILPDSSCVPTPLWNGADLDVTGVCDGDEVIFTLTNNGDNMTEPVEFVVIEDVMIQFSAQTSVLLAGESEQIPMPGPVANGATWRVMVNEVENHPFDLTNTVAVEGCGGFTAGFVTQFTNGDEEHYLDIDCRQNIGSWDPNDKQGFPVGTGEEHIIEAGQEIDYLIRFQNTGTDTAFSVAIHDVLDPNLDWTSVEVGASSHDYRFEMYGEGEMVFYFDDIMLPDSNINEPASHGFVKFKIQQKPGLALGSTIENEAAIFFDFNEPVITNRTLHTLGEDLIQVTSTKVLIPNIKMEAYPNPFESWVTFKLDGLSPNKGTLSVFDSFGRIVDQQNFVGNQLQYNGQHLPEGVYFFKINADGKDVASGKLLK